jgi:hypothetical protein
LWYYKSFGQEMGPIEFAELTRLAANGEIAPSDPVRQGPAGTWRPAEKVPKLFSRSAHEERKRLEQSGANVTVSSQRLGPRAVQALQEQQRKATEARRLATMSKAQIAANPEDFAAAVLADSAGIPRSYPPAVASGGGAPAIAGSPPNTAVEPSAPAAPASSLPSPPPSAPPRFTPPPKAGTGFVPGPKRRSSGGGFDWKEKFESLGTNIPAIGGAVLVLALVAGLWFMPWGTLFFSIQGAYTADMALWARIQELHERKAPKEEWRALEASEAPRLKRNLATLNKQVAKSDLHRAMYILERDALLPMMSTSDRLTEQHFERARDLVAKAEQAHGK